MNDLIRLLETILPPLVTLVLGIWGGKVHERRKGRRAKSAPSSNGEPKDPEVKP